MRKICVYLSFLLFLTAYGLASAEREVHVINNKTYYCGDSLEVIFPDEPVTLTEVTRNPGSSKVVQARADRDTILFEVRIKVTTFQMWYITD